MGTTARPPSGAASLHFRAGDPRDRPGVSGPAARVSWSPTAIGETDLSLRMPPMREHGSGSTNEGDTVASNGGSLGGIGLGGILVIAGVLVAIFGSFWLGVIIALVGLIAFGGFAKGKWY